jgi:TRAP transporter TAXI family solute receptor
MKLSKICAAVAASVVLAFSGTNGVSAQTVGIGSNPQGSAAYATAAAVAKVVSQTSDLNMRVIPQGGPVVTIPLVNSGELEFSISNSIPVFFAQRGGAMFKDRPQPGVKMVASLYNLNVGFFVRNDSDIKTLADLKGRRISSEFTKQKVLATMQGAILATVGMTMADVEGVPVPSGARGVEDFIAGKVDAGLFSVTSGVVLQADASVGGIRWLPVSTEAEAQAKLVAKAPGSFVEEISPAENRPGVTQPTGVFAGPFLLLAGDNTSEEVVYAVTKTLYENASALAAADKSMLTFDPEKMAPDLNIEMHPGAVRFYKEIGLMN